MASGGTVVLVGSPGKCARTAAFAAFFVAIAWVARAPYLARTILDSEEGVYLAMARALLRGAMPYTSVWDHKPPGVYLLYASFLKLFGESVGAVRIGATLAVAATALLISLVAARLFGRLSLALLAGSLYVVAASRGPGLAANTELLLSPFAIAGAWLLLAPPGPSERSTHRSRILLAGLCLGVAIQIKPVAIFELVALGLWLYLSSSASPKGCHRTLIALFVGAVLPLAAVMIWFRAHGLLDLYLSCNVETNLRYVFQGKAWGATALVGWRDALSANGILWAGAALFFAWPSAAGEKLARTPRARTFLACLAAGELAALMSAGRFYGHYFVEILPSLALLCAGLVARIAGTFRTRRGPLLVAAALAAAIWCVPVIASAVRYAVQPASPPDTAARVAAYIRDRLEGGDTLFVPLWEPVVYFLVDARPATRFVMPNTLVDPSLARAAGINRIGELRQILSSAPTWIVVLERPPDLNGVAEVLSQLRPVLASSYERVLVTDGVAVYRRLRAASGDYSPKREQAPTERPFLETSPAAA